MSFILRNYDKLTAMHAILLDHHIHRSTQVSQLFSTTGKLITTSPGFLFHVL